MVTTPGNLLETELTGLSRLDGFITYTFRAIFRGLRNDERWRGPLVEALKPRSKDRILVCSIEGALSGADLSQLFPDVDFLDATASAKAANLSESLSLRCTASHGLTSANEAGSLIARSSIDQIVAYLVLCSLPSEEKGKLLRAFFKALRRGGILHLADLDQPDRPHEQVALNIARIAHGRASTQDHSDGNWTDHIVKAGFTNMRRLSSHSFSVARVAVIKARKW